jgi:hypothetical protein
MGLLDMVMTAQGDGGSPNYGRPGRYVVRLGTMRLRDMSEPGANPALGNGFRFDGEVLACNNGEHRKGDVVTFTDPFRYPQNSLQKVRKLLQVAKQSKSGKPVTEATLGLELNDGESEASFAERVKAEVKRLLGPTQPVSGAIVTVLVTGGVNKTTQKPYSLFDAIAPNEDDLKNAGLI